MLFNFPTEKFIQKEQRQIIIGRLFRRIFLEDWLIKLTALAITFALWLGVTGLQAPLTTRLSSVSFSPLINNDLAITNSPVKEVDLIITGDKRKIDQLNPRDLVVSMDLRDVKEGQRTIQITKHNITVDLPSGVKIEKIEPDRFAIKLEKIEEFEVRVRAETEGTLAPGFEIYETKIAPEKVRVRGPKSFVESLDFVSTEKINIDKLKSNFTAGQIPLNIVNPQVTILNAVSASVLIRIGRKRIERLFVIPYTTATRAGRASVTLYGPDNILERLTVDDLQIKEERSETGTVRLGILLPEGIKNEVKIQKVKYRE